ncbi:hypothetical protein OIU78_012755 [Salix suchowensis]|nr:hypothetical protein OIU78_012755 [Salix suchowensis]
MILAGFSSSKLSKQISGELSDAGTKWKTIATERVPSKTERVIVYGPWGGVGGSKFDDGTYTGIRQIHLSRHVGIASIRVQYDRDGQAIWGSKHGGSGGFKSDKIIFDYPYEILTRVTGTYGPLMYMGPNVIKSLTFYTNKGKHGPFGEEQGPSFANKIDEGKIIGFHGREGFLLDAIGAHVLEGTVKPAKHHLSDAIKHSEADVAEIDNSPWSNKLVAAKPGQTEEVVCGVIKEPAPCGPGPWGGDGGRPWDDGVFSGIKQIFITRAEAICSIQIEYDRNGQSVWSIKHGGNGGTATHRVKLQCPHEVLVCLSGILWSHRQGREESQSYQVAYFSYQSRKVWSVRRRDGNIFHLNYDGGQGCWLPWKKQRIHGCHRCPYAALARKSQILEAFFYV